MVLTGAGDSFMAAVDGPSLGELTKPMGADVEYMEGRRSSNGSSTSRCRSLPPSTAPQASTANTPSSPTFVIASDTTVFSDFPHPAFGIVPGDGMHIAWEELLGLNRARHLMMTGGSFTARQALEWGAVAEVTAQNQVVSRAQDLAETMAARPQLLSRLPRRRPPSTT